MSTGALIRACQKSATIQNTGSECADKMGPTMMLIAVPQTAKWNATQLAAFTAYILARIHDTKANRWYPMFGPAVPIRKITTSKESDVIPVQDDGVPIFVRYGTMTRAYGTTEGGICFAQALQSLNASGYSIIEVDNAYQFLMRNNGDGTYSALRTTFMYSPSPDLADLKNPGYTHFQITYTPQEYVSFGEIFQGDSSIANIMGLINAQVLPGTTASSLTNIYVSVQTICGLTDMIAEFGSALAVAGNFIVTNASGVVQTVTAVAIVGGQIQLTGTWTHLGVYTISLAPPATLLANNVEGYEGTVSATVTIP